jgi:catechol 2,3-dioxygenase-like lactoylglutathione lyase family enzyme
MTVERMDNVGIVVEDLRATVEFLRELGLELEGRAIVRRLVSALLHPRA